MTKTCLVCNAPHLEMMSILGHPTGLDSMLRFLLGLQANEDDYLCKSCCSEVTNAFDSKQKLYQFNQLESEVFGSNWAPIKGEVDPGDQIENAVSLRDPVVKIEPESDDLEKAVKVKNEPTHVKRDEMLKPDFDLQLGAKLHPGVENDKQAQKSFWTTVGGESDSTKLKRTRRSSSVSQEAFNIVNPDAACKQNGSEDCLEYFKREKSVDIKDSADEEKFDAEREDIIITVDSSESKEVAVAGGQKNTIIHCEVCKKSYHSILRFQNHLKREHPNIKSKNTALLENPYKCPYNIKHQIHVRKHTKKKLYVCSECGKGFANSYTLRIHKMAHTGEKPYKCSYCSKTFTTSSRRGVHMKTHLNEKPYVCRECGKGFSTSYTLKAHERIHTGEKPYKCSYCSKTFTTSSRRGVHMKTHLNEKPYVCRECGKGFLTSYTLKAHERIHTGEKPYKCSYCSQNFTTIGRRGVHMKTHLNEKPYVCRECGKGFSTSYTLKAHERIHTGEKPYKCSYCSKTFTRSSSRRVHMKKHTNEKQYKQNDSNNSKDCLEYFKREKSVDIEMEDNTDEKILNAEREDIIKTVDGSESK